MLKIDRAVLALLYLPVVLTACAISPEQSSLDENGQYFKTKHNTANMSDFDRQKYFTDHNLGPVPPTYHYKSKTN